MSSFNGRQWIDNTMTMVLVLATVALLSAVTVCTFFSCLAILGTENVSGYALTAAAVILVSASVYRLAALYFARAARMRKSADPRLT